MAACAKCGATLAEGATFCGSCGTAVGAAPAASASGGAAPTGAAAPAAGTGMASNVAGALAYVTLIPAILFIVLEQFKSDKFVRFHAFQSLFFQIAWIVLIIGMTIVGAILAFIPVLGWILDLLLWLAIGLGGFVCWVFLVFKAYSNEKFQLPVIGKFAEEQAAK